MLRLTDKETFESRRLVLGIDADCMTCSDLGRQIEEKAGDKLEVRNLREPQVEEWRKRALGEDAPWAPTLLEVRGFKVRAWTGPLMGINLGRFLGPVATWRVMQALGEVGAALKRDESPAAKIVAGMSRGQFLKGVGGAAVAMSLLSGVGSLARPADADVGFPAFTKSRRLVGTELKNYCNAVADRSDCGFVAGSYATAMQAYMSVSSETDGVASNSYGVHARAYEHTTADGLEMYACSFDLKGQKVISYYSYSPTYKRVKTHITRWGIGPNGSRAWSERMSVNGAYYTDPSAPSLQVAADCPTTCSSISGYFQQSFCGSINLDCLLSGTTCAGCSTSCAAGLGFSCLTCALPGCIVAIKTCCATACTVCIPCAPSI